ncbi:MAG: FAD-dependent oxidoreductase [Pirellulaceae bacterium]|nr:FAD-dependent oxidoreductase [Pirellulaceae bacterium]
MKLVIVGAVAGGASAAARARRLCENSEIILLEKGAEPSFANCGLPYYVGGEISSRDSLLVAPKQRLIDRYNLDVRTRSLVTSINRSDNSVTVRNLESGETYIQPYDKLILSTGASPIRPPLPGIDSPRIHTLRDLADADQLHAVASHGAKRAVVVGAGFIGIEVAENLRRRSIDVSLVELGNQILPPWDREMTRDLESHLVNQGVDLHLSDSVVSFSDDGQSTTVQLTSGKQIQAGFAVLCVGVTPENGLAKAAGLEIGQRGGMITTQSMQTSDPDIYAVGDVVEVTEFVSGRPVQIPLAGPANRQGRIAADHLFGRPSQYRGTQGTAIVGVFGKTAAMTGLSEKMLTRFGIDYEKVYVHPADHAGYFPGATKMTLKLIFSPDDGRVLGAQACGTNGVDKRIDVLSMAIQGGMTVYDLEEAELCYAPQYGSAKDPVNMAGFVAAGVLRRDQPIVHADQLCSKPCSESSGPDTVGPSGASGTFLLDVRTPPEYQAGHIDGAVNIPLESLRSSLRDIPDCEKVIAYCAVGQRGYMATRLLRQHGLDAYNLSGGFTSWNQFQSGDSTS